MKILRQQAAIKSPFFEDITPVVGLLWFIIVLLFIAGVVNLLFRKYLWGAFYVFCALGFFIGYEVWSFNVMLEKELKTFLASIPSDKKVVTREAITKLPLIVKKWLERSNVVGKEIVSSIHLKQIGEMRTDPTGKWMPVNAEQWFKTKTPAFIWIADVKAAPGMSLVGRDIYEKGQGHMLIKLFNLITVVDKKGKETDQGAMVRYLAEIIWFPSAAVSDYISWEQVDLTTAKATMNYGGISASGLFKFNANGEVISFEAKRYYSYKGRATLENWFIQIPKESYKTFEGVNIPTRGEVTWRLKEGDFTWYKLEIKDVKYNIGIGQKEDLAH